MSYYLNIYRVDHSAVSNVLGKYAKTIPFKFGNGLDSKQKMNLTRLLKRRKMGVKKIRESDDAVDLIVAFENICKQACKRKVTIEFYLDEDKLPELWDFCIGHWDEADDFNLPLSPHGTPMVIYRNGRSLMEFRKTFKAMFKSGKYDVDCISKDDLSGLIDMVDSTVKEKGGIFIFCCQ